MRFLRNRRLRVFVGPLALAASIGLSVTTPHAHVLPTTCSDLAAPALGPAGSTAALDCPACALARTIATRDGEQAGPSSTDGDGARLDRVRNGLDESCVCSDCSSRAPPHVD